VKRIHANITTTDEEDYDRVGLRVADLIFALEKEGHREVEVTVERRNDQRGWVISYIVKEGERA
jgi:hypothetical protein